MFCINYFKQPFLKIYSKLCENKKSQNKYKICLKKDDRTKIKM